MKMISPEDSLVKYDNPFLVPGTLDKKYSLSKGRPLKASSQQIVADGPVPTPPKTKSATSDTNQQQVEEILHEILPPREWKEGNQLWIQRVSSAPSTRQDVVNLQKELFLKMQQRQARATGICPIRRELFTQCFDELIRQVTINCAERGMLLLHVRDELLTTINAYKALYESSLGFGMRKALHNQMNMNKLEQTSAELRAENEELNKQLQEEKAKYEDFEKREKERQHVEEKQHAEEILFLKRTIQQLKEQLQAIIAPNY